MTDTLALLKLRRSVPPQFLAAPGPDERQLSELLTIAARVPSLDSCNSRMAPGKRDDTGVESTGMRAGCPDASWMTRTTLLPSTTTHTGCHWRRAARTVSYTLSPGL